MLIPGNLAPELEIETIGHGQYSLSDNPPPAGTLVVFYRGLHCPICRDFLKQLDDLIGDFALRGVRLLALSGDTQERANQLIDDMQIIRLPIGYGLAMKAARDDWGLYISQAREGTQEPALFSEPGLFWVGPKGDIQFVVTQSLPFIRPTVPAILKALDLALSKKFPPRGSYTGTL